MSRLKTYTIGRSSTAEIQIDALSVSRRHAEIVIGKSGREYFLTDCKSTGGTCVVINGKLSPIRQAVVRAGDIIQFGEHKTKVSHLLKIVETLERKQRQSQRSQGKGALGSKSKPDHKIAGRIKRNPSTGELEPY